MNDTLPHPINQNLPLSEADLETLRQHSTPTVVAAWERITQFNPVSDGINLEPMTDFAPSQGVMVGRTITVVIQSGHVRETNPDAEIWKLYLGYVASIPGKKVILVQDLDKPRHNGTIWSAANVQAHHDLGCAGTITDGMIANLDRMHARNFRAIGAAVCVGPTGASPVGWGCGVEVFGQRVFPGQIIHADRHGFIAIPEEDEQNLLQALTHPD